MDFIISCDIIYRKGSKYYEAVISSVCLAADGSVHTHDTHVTVSPLEGSGAFVSLAHKHTQCHSELGIQFVLFFHSNKHLQAFIWVFPSVEHKYFTQEASFQQNPFNLGGGEHNPIAGY